MRGYIVIARKGDDGVTRIPFDPDVHEDHRKAMLGHLTDAGHVLEMHPDGTHAIVHSGPLLTTE